MRDSNATEFLIAVSKIEACVLAAESLGTLPAGTIYRLRRDTAAAISTTLADWQDVPDPEAPTLADHIRALHWLRIEGSEKLCNECSDWWPCDTIELVDPS